MTVCYTQLRLHAKHPINFSKYSYTALFIAQDSGRKFETKKSRIHSTGISVEASFALEKNERPINCFVYYQIYLPTGRALEPQRFIGTVYYDGSGITPQNKLTKHEIKLISNYTKKTPENNVYQVPIPNTVPAPGGLSTVAYYHSAINESAKKYNVDAQAIASIIFQEKFYPTAAKGKNIIAYAVDKFDVRESASYGLGEMQLGLAADLLGYPKSDAERLRKAFNLITNDPKAAIDLVSKNISQKQQKLGRKLLPREAAILHNAGDAGLDSYLNLNSNKKNFDAPSKIYNRSRNWQNAIEKALDGIIYSLPDNCSICEATPHHLDRYWKSGEGYSGL